MAAIYSWTLLRAGSLRLDGGGMFGVIPKAIWSRTAKPDDHNRIALQTNCLLLEGDAGKVLIETGFGDKWTDKERGFYDLERRTVLDALGECNTDPADIKNVIVTHLHFDHAAGLTTVGRGGKLVPTFPNAEIIVQKEEWVDALDNKSTMNRTYLRSHLDPIADRVRLIEGNRDVLPGIIAWPMVGHTWGMQAVRFDDARGTVVFPGDVLPTVNHVGLPFSLGYDMLPYHNMLSKLRLYQNCVEGDWRLVLDHEPGHAVFRVRPDPTQGEKFLLEEA